MPSPMGYSQPGRSTYFHIPYSTANNDLSFKNDLVNKMDDCENNIF